MFAISFDDDLAVHVVEALRRDRKHLRNCGRAVPSGYSALERLLGAHAMPPRSQKVTEGQPASNVELAGPDDDGDAVTATTLLTHEQAAQRMRCSTSTLKRRIRAGELDVVRNGRLVRITVGAIDAFIAAKTVSNTAKS